MSQEKFKKENLEFHLPSSFKGLSKEYMLQVIFDNNIQSKWIPTVGDIMVGKTGNVWVISSKSDMHESLGGTLYFFGGNLCASDGSRFMTEVTCHTMNEKGVWITWVGGELKEQPNLSHSSYKDFRFVPYPHETDRMQ